MIRTIVVEDEPPSRLRLSRMLRRVPDVVVVGEAASGAAAVALIESAEPDLVLLDIHLPDIDGFSVLRQLDEPFPAIVFVTAYDEHAVAAFEAEAVDYLMKPVRHARLGLALERVRARQSRAVADQGIRRIAATRPGAPLLARLPVRDRGRVLIVPIVDITSIVVDHGLVFVTTPEGRFSTKYTNLQEIERTLRIDSFQRVHRQAFVNIEHVREVLHADNATARLRLSVVRKCRSVGPGFQKSAGS